MAQQTQLHVNALPGRTMSFSAKTPAEGINAEQGMKQYRDSRRWCIIALLAGSVAASLAGSLTWILI